MRSISIGKPSGTDLASRVAWLEGAVQSIARASNVQDPVLDNLDLSGDYQPHDDDLDGIAALVTVSYGRNFLTYADEATFKAAVNLEANIDFYAPGGTDVAVADGGTGASTAATARANLSAAPKSPKYIVQIADAELANAQALSALATGMMKNTTTTGVLSIAVEGTDYWKPGGTDVAIVDGGTGASTAAAARNNLGAAPFNATFIMQTANSETSAEQALSSLATGLVMNTTGTGVLLIATPGTDYYNPGGTDVAVADGGTGVSTLTGLVKGNGASAFTAAVEGTDYWKPGGTDVAIVDGGTGASTPANARNNLGAAPFNAAYIMQTANSETSAEQALSALATGLVKNTTATGVLSIGVAGTDFQAAGAKLDSIQALTWAADKLMRLTSTSALDTIDFKVTNYTPTITLSTNMDAVTVTGVAYLRFDTYGIVFGLVSSDATAAGAAKFFMTLPFGSGLAAIARLAGVGSTGAAEDSVRIIGETVNGVAQFDYTALNGTARTMSFIFIFRP